MNDSRTPNPTDGKGKPSTSDTGQSAGDDPLAIQLSEMARSLGRQETLEQTLNAIVHAAVGTVPGVQHASITAIQRRHEVHTPASTGELPRAIDNAQYVSGQGPCLSTLFEHQTVRLSDTNSEQRWPKFTKRAAELGVRSMLSIQLYVEGSDLGALNLMSEQVDAFGDESEHVGLLFASHAALAMAGARQVQHLTTALNSRGLIGQAKGILMERYKISDELAFRLLVQASQTTHRRLHEIADELATTGELAAAASENPPPVDPSSRK